MTTYNWQFVQKPSGTITYCLCVGEKLHREFDDFNMASAFERSIIDAKNEISGHTIDDFLHDRKLLFEAKRDGKPYEQKVMTTISSQFRALQNKIKKKEQKCTQ